MNCLDIPEYNGTANVKIKHLRKKLLHYNDFLERKTTKREQYINFERKNEPLKGTANVLFCQYGLPLHPRI
jgi:hypothetical protein